MANIFKLRCSIYGHEKDVRALSATYFPDSCLVSGSRDRTARLWIQNETDSGFREGHVMSGHENFVSSICCVPPDESYPNGLILTGSNDNTILAFTLESPTPVYKLTGHGDTVCSLAAGKFGTVLSGSWDTTAKVWLKQNCVMTLKGHEAAVWAVAIMPERGVMITGSADKTVKSWMAGKCQVTFKGHTDCVRGLSVLDAGEFLSCSNDATVRHWVMTGDCIRVLYGHSNYIYCLAILSNGTSFITGSEDRTVRVWRNGECAQTIPHPAQSIWAVCALPNGDIATAASDGAIRIFTTNPDRTSSAEEQKAFDDQVASSTIPTQIGDIKMDELPTPDALLEPGTKEGQSKMVRVGDKVELYHWSTAEHEWKKIGDVMGATGGTQQTSGKVLYEGKEYDYVFDVDIQEGAPALKLPYNAAEDPWFAAQKFLEKNEISPQFLDQVANFIMDNTKGVTLGVPQSQEADPFTGGSRYVPSATSEPAHSTGSSIDPFTGAGRYVPSYTPNTNSSGGGGDPFTGKSRYKAQNGVSSGVNEYFPQKTYLTFDAMRPDQIIGKLKEINAKAGSGTTDSEIDSLASLMTGQKQTPNELQVLDKILNWPQESLFPVLDVLRLCVRFEEANKHFCKTKQIIVKLLENMSPGCPTNNQLMALRTICNIFSKPVGEQLSIAHMDDIMLMIGKNADLSQKHIQVASASVLMNFAVYLRSSDNIEGISKCLTVCSEVLQKNLDPEAAFRTLVAIGTLLGKNESSLAIGQSLFQMSVLSNIDKLKSNQLEKLSKCATVVYNLLM